MQKKNYDEAQLHRLRQIPSEEVLKRLAIFYKADPTFRPAKHATTRRYHALTDVGDFELLVSATRWYDTRAKKGGGGAIDLAMHLLELSFVDAVKRLIEMDWRNC
jgi:hypothetical protein